MMEKAEAVLNHALEIIGLLTVEDYILVKREADGNLRTAEPHNDLLDFSATRPDLSFTLPDVQERNRMKILELANNIIRLLTCEVPLKCQDVAVYFSKDEWEYLEGHREHYNHKRMAEGKEPPPLNHQNVDQRGPVQHRIKEEPDTGEYEEAWPAHSVGCIPPGQVKSEPRDSSDVDTLRTDSPQFHSSVTSHISEEPDDSDTQLSSLDDNFNNRTSKSKMIYQRTVAKNKNCRKLRSRGRVGPCDRCGKKFCSKASLSRHVKTHTGEKQFSCDECGKAFPSRNHVASHLRIHTGEKPFSCEECGRKFTMHNHLVLHKVVHTKEKPFTCPVCGKGFTRQSSVIKHSGIHAETKPHVCTECGKSYCQYANLVVHQRLHSGETPFICRYCNKGFILKATMIRHELLHTGKKPFTCPQCDKCFSDNSTLTKHKIKFHPKESEKS